MPPLSAIKRSSNSLRSRIRRRKAFTLVEMLVGVAILALLLIIISQVMSQVTSAIKTANAKLDAFQSARTGFEVMTAKLSQATLNTYWDYDNPITPTKYTRRSDMHFYENYASNCVQANVGAADTRQGKGHALFFQSPEAIATNSVYDQTQGLLNACGFYVEFRGDLDVGSNLWRRPNIVSNNQIRYRYRLMQAIQPSDNLGVYATNDTAQANAGWTTNRATSSSYPSLTETAWPLADNVIAIFAQARLSSSETNTTTVTSDYKYDSRTTLTNLAIQRAQLPPVIDVTMVVMDENSASRLEASMPAKHNPPTVIENALAGKFVNTASNATDMAALETALRDANVRYQVMSASILLRESKWSSTPAP